MREPCAYLAAIAGGILVNFYQSQAIENACFNTLLSLPEQECRSRDKGNLVGNLIQIDPLLDGLSPKARQAFLMAQLRINRIAL